MGFSHFLVIFFHSVLSLLSFLHPLIPIAWKSSSTSSIHFSWVFLWLSYLLASTLVFFWVFSVLPSASRVLPSSFNSWFFLLLQIPFQDIHIKEINYFDLISKTGYNKHEH
jgi:hypothetical protein